MNLLTSTLAITIALAFFLSFFFPFSLFADEESGLGVDKAVDDGRKPVVFMQEDFEDTDWKSRGWYDAPRFVITSGDHAPVAGSRSCMKCHFAKGATGTSSKSARLLIPETEEVCLSFWVKFSKSWVGSGKAWHPHVFHFMTNANKNKYAGPAYSHLTLYIEHINRVPTLGIQDGMNIDESRVGQDLTQITEKRSIAGGNGDSDGYGGHYYRSGKVHWNGKHMKADKQYFTNERGPFYKNDWHFIEAYFKLNSIKNGKGVADGVVQYWYDGKLLIDCDDVMLRTGQHPDMKFDAFLVAPHIGHGSPVDQTFWIDEMKFTDIPFSRKRDESKG